MVREFFNIDDHELDAMRHQIHTSYPLASTSRKAILLSNQLWQKITPHFNSYDDHQRESLTLELFQRTLISNRPITADDIVSLFHQYTPTLPIELLPEREEIKPTQSEKHRTSLGFMRYFSLLALLIIASACMIGLTFLLTPASQQPAPSSISFKHFSQLSWLMTPPITVRDVAYIHVNPFAFAPLNNDQVIKTLSLYDSELLNGDYIQRLQHIAQEENINPALILSIIGQEQGFVPQNHPFKSKIINNPYNLFGSWEKRQISFEESTRIACRFVNRLLLDCPTDANPFKWINHTYAEDDRWYIGVEYFFNVLAEQ